jgi:3-mercaptopyruvate sulfurtransferase SseA
MELKSNRRRIALILVLSMLFACLPAASGTVYAKTATRASKVTRVYPSHKSFTMRTGTWRQFKYKLSPSKLTSSAKKVKWSSSKSSVASVTQSGTVSAKKSGHAVITAKTRKGGKKTTWKVTVKKSDVETSAAAQSKVYVTPKWVKSVIDGNQTESKNYIILECAWGPASESGTYYRHIPGAVHMNVDLLEDPETWNICDADELTSLMKEYGITKDTTVICYGKNGKDVIDDRVAFAMLYAGVENVKCVDGGYSAWRNTYKYSTESKEHWPQSTSDSFGTEIPANSDWIVDTDDVLSGVSSGSFKLVSTRTYSEFTGTKSGYNYISRAGEPKGAIWGGSPTSGNYFADGKTVTSDTIAEYIGKYDASIDDELVFYSGNGWSASVPFLILYQEGKTNMKLYDGGWYMYQKTDSNPVQVGDPLSSSVKYTTAGELD